MIFLIPLFISISFGADILNPKFEKEVASLTKKFNVKNITVKDLSIKLKKKSEIILLDIREKKEFKTSHILGAIHAGYDDFDIDVIKKKLNKTKLIITYCSVGYRSSDVGDKLLKEGYNVLNLKGGIFEWVNQGHAVHKGSAKTKEIHTYNKKWSKWVTKGEKVY